MWASTFMLSRRRGGCAYVCATYDTMILYTCAVVGGDGRSLEDPLGMGQMGSPKGRSKSGRGNQAWDRGVRAGQGHR